MREQDHRLFRMIDCRFRQAGLIVNDQGDYIFSGNIARGDNRELVPADRRIEMNAADAPARNCAAHGDAVNHSGKR